MLWLIGMMGSGKTTVGRLVAGRLGVAFRDTDTMVEEESGRSIPELWAEAGEAGFRVWERRAVATASSSPAVVATGGGAVIDRSNVAIMRRGGVVVWLAADPATLAARIGSGDGRPLLAGEDPHASLALLARQRAPWYEAAAHHVVVTDDKAPSEVADEVEALWPVS